MKLIGEYKKKKINGLMDQEELMEDEMKMCDGNDNQQTVRIY
jgi:hypothetical protein